MTITTLKLLGLCSMLWDHFSALFPPWAFLPGPLARVVPYFGRLAAPIFLYSVVSGFRHTKSRKRYGQRLLCFALLSQLPYWFFFCGEAHRYGNSAPALQDTGLNILFSLFLGLVMLTLVERFWLSSRLDAAAGAAVCMILARILGLEGGEGYLLIILTLYFLTDRKKRPWQLELLLLLLAVLLGRWRLILMAAEMGMHPTILLNTLGPFLGLALAYFGCNSEKGPAPRWFRWVNYLFYPLHFLVLGLVGLALPPL